MIKATRILLAIMFALSLSLVSMGVAQADYNDPPGWDDNLYFTHQTWDFLTDDNPSGPTVDDNRFGIAEYEAFGTDENPITWHSTYEGRTGVWEFDEESIIDFIVPNSANPSLIKEVWFQATYYTVEGGHISEDSWIYPDDPFDAEVTFGQVSREAIEGEAGWYRETWMGTITPQPGIEDFAILFDGGFDEFGDPIAATVFLTEVDIDTQCVPIPGAAWLLFSAFLGILGVRRKK